MGSKPEREDETPSAGINWKLFLLIAGIIGAVFFAGMAMQGDGDSISSTVDADSPNIDIGQGSGPDNPPVAVETETEEEIKTSDDYDYNIEVRNTGYHSIDEKGRCSAICCGHTVKGVPANATILSDIKVSGEKIEFYIENTWKYPRTISPFTISINVVTVHPFTGEVVEVPLSYIYRTEEMRLEPGEKKKVVIGEDIIRSFRQKEGCPLKIVGIRVDSN